MTTERVQNAPDALNALRTGDRGAGGTGDGGAGRQVGEPANEGGYWRGRILPTPWVEAPMPDGVTAKLKWMAKGDVVEFPLVKDQIVRNTASRLRRSCGKFWSISRKTGMVVVRRVV